MARIETIRTAQFQSNKGVFGKEEIMFDYPVILTPDDGTVPSRLPTFPMRSPPGRARMKPC